VTFAQLSLSVTESFRTVNGSVSLPRAVFMAVLRPSLSQTASSKRRIGPTMPQCDAQRARIDPT